MGRRAAILGLAALCVVGCGSGAATPQPTGSAAGPGVAGGRGAVGIARHAFAIYRRPERAGDQIPVDQANGGVRPAISRLAYSGPLGTMYAYVHRGLLCISYATRVSSKGSGSASGGCQGVGDAAAGGVAAPIRASLDALDRVALFLPDGVRTVTVTSAGGSRRTLAVKDNAVVYAGSGLRSWTFTTTGGAVHAGALAPRPAAGPRK